MNSNKLIVKITPVPSDYPGISIPKHTILLAQDNTH